MARLPDDEDATSDANALFRDDSPMRVPVSRPAPVTGGDEYDLLGDDDPVEDVISKPVPPVVPVASPAARPPRPQVRTTSDEAKRRKLTEDDDDFGPSAVEARVDHPWSRWAEWGPDLRNLALAAAGWIFLLYLFLSNGAGFFWSFLLFGVGFLALIVMCYPMAITMERPIRVTPEQAVRDYFGALTHFRPHYRRMWLLLSSAGRQSAGWRDFGGFQDYWRSVLLGIREGKDLGRAPLSFQVQDFRSEKSAGKTALNAKFSVRVRAQDFSGELGKELGVYRMAIGLVRGPDKMWYLNDGTLPIRVDPAGAEAL